MAEMTELRLEVPREDVSVLDGFCAATGRSRSDVIRSLLSSWSRDRLHEAIVICRVAGVNPAESEISRK